MAAGMDGYIEKPIDPAGLENEVGAIWEKFQRGVGGNGVDPTITAVFDRQEFLNRIYRDRALLLQVTELFQEDAPSKLADLRSAMERKDPVAVAKAAHALKGMVSNFSAYRAQRIAHSVETAARSEILLGGPELVNQLGEQIEQLTTQLLALAGEPAS